ncbi:MAG: hypothetical protein H7245_11770, partial [Candidatus Saccharibacteria bacterium]|nr:hypothetical protein [Pseudorhodobacter sp.]
IITSQRNAARFYNENLREVTSAGVAAAMGTFLATHGLADSPPPDDDAPQPRSVTADEQAFNLVCEEVLLEAFAK